MLRDVTKMVDLEADKLVFDDSWEAAQRQIRNIKMAMQTLEDGNDQQAYLDKMAKLSDPDDRRTMGEKLLEYSNAWT
jgi:hypothetical protein